jgi:uncharacterized damage-inducible protein DinB
MDPQVAAHLRMMDELRRQILESVAPLDDAQINHAVPGLRNTIAILLRHTAGSERYWVVEVVGGSPINRNRDAEFDQAPVRKAELLAEIDRAASQTREVLDRLTAAELLTEVEVKRPSGVMKDTKVGALLHAMQHMAYHLGQIRQLAKLVQGG